MKMGEKIIRDGIKHITALTRTVHVLWGKCCTEEGIPPSSKFVVFTGNNKYLPFYESAVKELLEAKDNLTNYGYVGLKIK